MKITREMIKTYTYDGSDDMININSNKVPKVNEKFKCKLLLKNGKTIKAPDEWRSLIWNWWYQHRLHELIRYSNRKMVDVANSLLKQKNKIPYRD